MITLENAKATNDTIDALKSGSAAVQALQQGLYASVPFKLITSSIPSCTSITRHQNYFFIEMSGGVLSFIRVARKA